MRSKSELPGAPDARLKLATARVKILWGAETIARRISASGDFVRDTLVNEPGSPVRKIGGRYCAIEADLIAYFRPQPADLGEP